MPVAFGLPRPDLSQGDLFDLVPSILVKDLGYMIKVDDARYKLQQWRPGTLNVSKEHAATATAVRRPGLLLTHDCEIDKNPSRATLLISLIRPLGGVPDEHQAGFRDYTRHRAFYLPETPQYLSGENYADLRAITTIRRDTLEALPRLASMNEDGRRMLREHLFRFFTRRFLPSDWTSWPDDD